MTSPTLTYREWWGSYGPTAFFSAHEGIPPFAETNAGNVWTQVDEGSRTVIAPGFRDYFPEWDTVLVEGYWVTVKPWEDESTLVLVAEDDADV